MNQSTLTYEQLEASLVTWARSRPDLLAIIVVGSRARVDHSADEWSDLDLVLFTTNPRAYVSQADWREQLGPVWLSLLNETGRGDPEWLVLFAGGLKVDFVVAALPADAGSSLSVQQMLEASPYQLIFRRGVRVLYDRAAGQVPLILAAPAGASPAHPTPGEFLTTVSQALLAAIRVAKLLRRGELWGAKQQCDCDLKQCLLTMLEWHARATKGRETDTWHEGRFLEEWADPRAVAALPDTFAAYYREDLWRALFATLDLFRWLARETAERLDYSFPADVDSSVTEWTRSVFAGRQDGSK